MGSAGNPVGIIGLGLIGSVLARRLLAAGFSVVGYDVDPVRMAKLGRLGARTAASVSELGDQCERVLIAVFDTSQVEEVIEGAQGLLVVRERHWLVLNVTTSDPARIAALSARIAPRGISLLEVPLSGTSEQVAGGDGVGLIGGDETAYTAAADLLDAICPRRYYLGTIGSGAKAKLAVNLILGLNRAALAEGIVFAETLGLDAAAFLEVARGSAAYSQIMDIKGAKMIARDFSPHGRIAQHLKDVRLMLDYAARGGQALPLMKTVEGLLESCMSHSEGDLDNCAVIEAVRRSTR